MTAAVREAVRMALEEKGMSQADLARELGMERANVNRLLQGASGKIPDTWQRVLDALGLELVALQPDQLAILDLIRLHDLGKEHDAFKSLLNSTLEE